MGHTEEDKELMMIRMETLKTMIGKLKYKNNQSGSGSQNSIHTNLLASSNQKAQVVKDKLSTVRSKDVNARPSNMTSQSSTAITKEDPDTSPIRMKHPVTSPKSTIENLSSNRNKTVTSLSESLNKWSQNKYKSKISYSSVSSNQISPTINQTKTPVTSASISKSQISSKSNTTKTVVTSVSSVNDQISSEVDNNKLRVSNSSFLSSCSPLSEIKSITASQKSHSDSEILFRRSVQKNKVIKTSSFLLNNPAKSASSRRASTIPASALHASDQPSKISVFNNATRPSMLLSNNPTKPKPDPVIKSEPHTYKNADMLGYKSSKTSTVTHTKFVQKPPSHTITKPTTMKITQPTSSVTLTLSNHITTSIDTKQHIKNNISCAEKTTSKPGKILFERSGKILFDRRTTNQANLRRTLLVNTAVNMNPSTKTLIKTQNFAQEYNGIRKRYVAMNTMSHQKIPPKFNSHNKFYSSAYISPVTSEKARIILSKYKLVRKNDQSSIHNIKRKYPNYSKTKTNPSQQNSSNILPSFGKILFQRYKPLYKKKNSISHHRITPVESFTKGNRYMEWKIYNNYRNFVFRRIRYIRRVDVKPFKPKIRKSLQSSDSKSKGSTKKEIILSRHGTNYKVAGNLKSLRRLSAEKGEKKKTIGAKPVYQSKYSLSKPGVYQTTYTLSRSNYKVLPSKSISAKRYVASQILKKTLVLTGRKKGNKDYCLFYNRFGKCKRGNDCHFIHDAEKIAVCTRFLRGTCKDEKCLFSHKLDPDKMPVCSYFLRGECGRDNCPYRHVNVGESASVCDDFLKGYCPRGKECTKKHILECTEFAKTGCCSKGKACVLTHRLNPHPKRKHSGSRPPKGFRQKRRKIQDKIECQENKKVPTSANEDEGKVHMLPKFISENIKLLRQSTSMKPTSFADIKKIYESTEPDKTSEEKDSKTCSSKGDLWGSDFIPLLNSSESESEDETGGFIKRMFEFKKR